MRLVRLGVLATALWLAVAQPAAAIGPGSSGDHAPLYYLSLGDSLAAGEQPIGDASNGQPTDEGYAEQLIAIARDWYPNLQLVKLGCSSGETTATMIDGGICDYPHGSQLDEALAFLHAHGKFVAFITIDIGANDFACQDDPSCLPPGFASIGRNLPRILAALRGAAEPGTPIVGANLYDPLLGYWLTGQAGQALAMASVPAAVAVNSFLGAIYGAAGVPVADVGAALSTTDFTTLVPLPPFGSIPLNVARICQWTWVCTPPPLGPNNHANAAGYGVMAQAFAGLLQPQPAA